MLFRAGVSGLTTALLLSRLQRYDITVVAKHMPGDYDIEYASPFAGANVIPSVPSLFLRGLGSRNQLLMRLGTACRQRTGLPGNERLGVS